MKKQKVSASKIVLGTWSWGSGINGSKVIFGKKIDNNDLMHTFNYAVNHGLISWDTALVYGFGKSEKKLGELSRDSNIQISTKYTPLIMPTRQSILRSFKQSCKNLMVDSIDVYWLHMPTKIELFVETVVPLLNRGTIRHVGVSNFSINDVKYTINLLNKYGHKLSAVQNHYSLLCMDSELTGLLDLCNKNSIEFWAYMVLEQGVLSGKYSVNKPLPPNSRRGRAFPPHKLSKLEPLIQKFQKLSSKYNVNVSCIPINWAISKGVVPLIGCITVEQIDDVLAATTFALSVDEIKYLEIEAQDSNIISKGSWE